METGVLQFPGLQEQPWLSATTTWNAVLGHQIWHNIYGMWDVLIKTPCVDQNDTTPTATINAPCEMRLSSPKSPKQRASFAGSWQQQEPAQLPVMSEQQSIQACQKHTQPWQGGFKASRDGRKEKGKGGGGRWKEGGRERRYSRFRRSTAKLSNSTREMLSIGGSR